ncbi:MAG: tRNA 2-thiouridine(34) synthase MnmA [Bacteroidales bacterium]|nr:tRNA 2-thiouridine(34) synthase MnmA [Bacteroidales bacterium]
MGGMNIAALVSGGVDSSVVVHLLKEQGYTPDIFYIRIGMEDEDGYIDCPAEEDIEITQWIAHHYGCRFEEVNLHKEYWDNVVSYTIESVRKGLTPNPDVMCNKLIKFGAFDDRRGKDYERIATGHYARIESLRLKIENSADAANNSQFSTLNFQFLATAVDPVKDQTDFLSQLEYRQIEKLMFPIGEMMKSEVRAVAAAAGLPSATRKDSQGICFLGKINYNDFIRRYLGEREGKIVELETGKVLGTHKGYWFHTIGQRKGLYLSGGPWFVVRKDIEENVLYVSQGYDPKEQYGDRIRLMGFHLLSGVWPDTTLRTHSSVSRQAADSSPILGEQLDSEGVQIKFKIRHTPEFHPGMLRPTDDGLVVIESGEPIQGIAAGQYATIYDKDAHLVLATGMII